MKRIFSWIGVLTLVMILAGIFTITGCTETATAASGEVTAAVAETEAVETSAGESAEVVAMEEELYVLVCDWQGDPVLRQYRYGMQKAAEFWTALGHPIKIEWVGAMEGNPEKVYTDLEATIAKNPTGILYYCQGLNEGPIVEDYLANGGMIFGTGGAFPADWEITGVIGTDNIHFGNLQGKKAIEIGGEDVRVGVYTLPEAYDHIQRVSGIKQAFEKYPNAEIVGYMAEGQSLTEGIQNVTAFLTANPDIDGFIGTSGTSQNIGTALKEAGVAPEEKFVVASDINDDVFNQIKEGYITGTLAQQFVNEGFYGVTIMHLRKMNPAPITVDDASLLATGFLPGPYNIITDNAWIDKTNIEIWLKGLNMDEM